MDVPSSFEFAKETVTQLITLATGVIGVSVTFAKDIRTKVTPFDRKWLFRSWSAFLISIIGGVWTLMAMTGTLSRGKPSDDAIYQANITMPSIIQVFAFLLGMAMLIVHAKHQAKSTTTSTKP